MKTSREFAVFVDFFSGSLDRGDFIFAVEKFGLIASERKLARCGSKCAHFLLIAANETIITHSKVVNEELMIDVSVCV